MEERNAKLVEEELNRSMEDGMPGDEPRVDDAIAESKEAATSVIVTEPEDADSRERPAAEAKAELKAAEKTAEMKLRLQQRVVVVAATNRMFEQTTNSLIIKP